MLEISLLENKNEHAWQDYLDSIPKGELTNVVFEKIEEMKKIERNKLKKLLEH